MSKTTINNKDYYIFKFVNMSFFSAHEVKIELHRLRKLPMGDGYFNSEYHKLSLVSDEIPFILGRPFRWQSNKGHPHCVIVRSEEDIREIIKDELHAIQIRVSLKHGLTGLSKVFEQEYANLADVKDGKFKPGTKFATI